MKMLVLLGIALVQMLILYGLFGQLVELNNSRMMRILSKVALYMSCLMPLQGGDLENAYFIFLIYMGVGILGTKDTVSRKIGNTFLFYAMTLAIKMISVRVEWIVGQQKLGVFTSNIIELLVSTILFYIVYKLFRQVMLTTKEIISDKIWILLTMIALATVGMVIMSMFVVGKSDAAIMNIMVIGLMTICLMSIISIFFIIEQIAKGAREESERKKLEWELEYYNDLKESQDQTRKLLHDMKNHIGTVHAMLYTEKITQATAYLNQLSGELNEQKSKIYCKHHVANALLNNKIKKMEEAHIRYTIEVDLPETLRIGQMEVGSILANTIDNAIEACYKIENPHSRIIQVKARTNQGKIFYEIKNTKSNNVERKDKRFMTSKEDKYNHGYGVRQVEDIVKRYNGIVEIDYDREWFRVTIAI